MTASYPIYRHGLVLGSNLSLPAAVASGAVDHLASNEDAFSKAIQKKISKCGGSDFVSRSVHRDAYALSEEVGRFVHRFPDYEFVFEDYRVLFRACITVCEKEKRSKILTRYFCSEIKQKPALALSGDDVILYFESMEYLAEQVAGRIKHKYKKMLSSFLASEEAKNLAGDYEIPPELELETLYRFTARAFDTDDPNAEMIARHLGEGDRLSALLEVPEYMDTFGDFWKIVRSASDGTDVARSEITDYLSDPDNSVLIYDNTLDDESNSLRASTDQRAFFVSQIASPGKHSQIDFCGVSFDPHPERDSFVKRPAYRMSNHVLMKYANQF